MQRDQEFSRILCGLWINYDKFMNWQYHQLWSEKSGKTVPVEQSKVAKVQITVNLATVQP